MMFIAGYVASPSKGKVGFIRAAAFGFYFLQAVPIAMAVFALLYGKIRGIELLDSTQLIYYLVGSTSALIFLLISAKAWDLSLWRMGRKDAQLR